MAVCDEILYSNPLIYIIYEDCYKIKNKNHHTFYEMWYAPRQEDNKK